MIRTLLKLFFLITLFQNLFNDFGFIVNYYDEFICVFLLLYGIIKNRISRSFTILIFTFIFINLINAYNSKLPFDPYRFILDVFLFLKPVIFLMILSQIPTKLFKEVFNFSFFISKSYLIAAFLFLPVHYFFGFFEFFDTRFGLNAYQFISNNAGEFTNLLLVSILISTSSGSSKQKMFFNIIGVILLMSTLRYKAFALAFILIIFSNRKILSKIYYFFKRKIERRKIFTLINLLKILPLILFFSIPGYVQFSNYFLSEDVTPRLLLLLEGTNIFLNNFPFGIGPGYFGSATSSLMYSPIYSELGWTNHWGLGENPEQNFLNDTFWSMIIAQYGFLGLIMVLIIYRKFFYIFFSIRSINLFKYSLLAIFSLIISTIGSSIFIGPLGLFYIMSKYSIEISNEE